MARKKSTQRKVKMDGDSGRNTPGSEETECRGENDRNHEELSAENQHGTPEQPSLSSADKHFEYVEPLSASVKVKQEPKTTYEYETTVCSTAPQYSHKSMPKMKQEPDLVTTIVSTTSMDLGSHFQQSLQQGHHIGHGLTWSHLMEPKNFPKPYEIGPMIKKENSNERSTSQSHLSTSKHDSRTSKSPAAEDSTTSKDLSTSTSTSVPSSHISGGTSSKSHATEGPTASSAAAGGGSSTLDLSKKGLPPEIRRMLASKYGLPKRSDESNSMVPNFAKSRSRFTVAPKKTSPDSNAEVSVAKTETSVSPTPSGNQDKEGLCPETSSAQATSTSTSTMTIPQVSVEPPSTPDDGDKLKNEGMLDLASHYGNLIKDAPPPVQVRSNSRSPHADNPSPNPGQQNSSEAMINLGSAGRLNKLRPPALRRVGEPMIDLSAMETPTSPLSPGFHPASFGVFPNPPYRSSNTTQSYRPRSTPTTRAPPRPLLSPRLPFPSHRSKSPDPRPTRPMIDLGKFRKSNDFPSMAKCQPSDISSLPNPVPQRIMPKRRHSLDSQSLREAKRSCPEQKKKEVTVKVESSVKLNISDLLKLEQEEQKCIKDLSFVQNKLTDMRFKLQMMQQELEGLQASETQIKRHIDIVRTKRVKILQEAQDREVSTCSVVTTAASDGSEKRSTERFPERSDHSDDMVRYDRASPFYQSGSSYREDPTEDFRGGSEMKRKGNLVTEVEGEKKENHERGRDRMVNRRVEIDRFGGYHYGSYGPRTIVQHSIRNNGEPDNLASAGYSTGMVKGEKSRLADNFSPSDSTMLTEALERHSGLTDGTDSGGVLVRQPVAHHPTMRRSSQSSIEDIRGPEHEGPKQFLGCLEISSTTSEVIEDQISTENERKHNATTTSSDQEIISSTVVSSMDETANEMQDFNEMEFIGHTDAVCAIIPFRKKLFSASADRTVRAFDLKSGKCLNTFQGHQKGINCLQIASDVGSRDRLFTGSNDQTVRAYNMASGTCTHKFSFRGRVMCLHIAFGKLFVGLSSGFVAVIDLKTNKCIDQFNCHEPNRISCLASTTGVHHALLCTGSFDSNITIRDQETGRLRRIIKDHKLTVLCMQIVGNVLFSGSADTIVQSHNINTGELIQSYVGHSMSVSGLQAMGGAQEGVLVTSSLDRIVRCFDIKSGDLLQLYGGNNDMIFSLAVCKEMIYTGCRDGKLSSIKLDLRKYHCCKWDNCNLKFGLLKHLKQHVQDHANQTYSFDTCLWENCTHKFQRGKLIDIMQGAVEHIMSHVPDAET